MFAKIVNTNETAPAATVKCKKTVSSIYRKFIRGCIKHQKLVKVVMELYMNIFPAKYMYMEDLFSQFCFRPFF